MTDKSVDNPNYFVAVQSIEKETNSICNCGVYYYSFSLYPCSNPAPNTPKNCLKCGKPYKLKTKN